MLLELACALHHKMVGEQRRKKYHWLKASEENTYGIFHTYGKTITIHMVKLAPPISLNNSLILLWDKS